MDSLNMKILRSTNLWSKMEGGGHNKNEFAIENVDYQVFDLMSNTQTGGRPTKDFALSIEFAKKISMMARTEKGKQQRELEDSLNLTYPILL